MGLLSGLFDSRPDYVKDIKKKIEAYCLDLHHSVRQAIEGDAIYYVENEGNWKGIEEGFSRHNRNAEYYSLFFVYLACRDLLRSGRFHIYAGIVGIEGNLTCETGCDCIDRLVQRGYISSDDAESSKSTMKRYLSDVGVG
jgi:hypothetical protein